MDYVTLNTGAKIPILGFGVYQIPQSKAVEAVSQAIKIGYRHWYSPILPQWGSGWSGYQGIWSALLRIFYNDQGGNFWLQGDQEADCSGSQGPPD